MPDNGNAPKIAPAKIQTADPLFKREKLERFISQADSLRPDLILFGGDLADISDSKRKAIDYSIKSRWIFAAVSRPVRMASTTVLGPYRASPPT